MGFVTKKNQGHLGGFLDDFKFDHLNCGTSDFLLSIKLIEIEL